MNWSTAKGTLTGPSAVPGLAAFSRACGGGTCITQPGVTQQLDSLADRLMYRLSYRNFGTREALLVNHSVASGGASGIRWYELNIRWGRRACAAGHFPAVTAIADGDRLIGKGGIESLRFNKA